MRIVFSLALFAALVAGKASAVEGGLGRSITGLQATNYSGVVPPDPGWSLAFGYAYYSGDIGAERELPISGVTALGLVPPSICSRSRACMCGTPGKAAGTSHQW